MAYQVSSAHSTWDVECQLKAGITASSRMIQQTSPSLAICFKLLMMVVRSCIDSSPPGTPLLMDVIGCLCGANGKACKETNCSCHREKLSCTLCIADDECCNPFTLTYLTKMLKSVEWVKKRYKWHNRNGD